MLLLTLGCSEYKLGGDVDPGRLTDEVPDEGEPMLGCETNYASLLPWRRSEVWYAEEPPVDAAARFSGVNVVGRNPRALYPPPGAVLPANEAGLLEVKLDRIDGARDWMRTSDLARIDADGYLFITGRADDAIIRGGFKVMAGKVADVIRQFPGVHDVIVLGLPDERLGEVPVALVEPYPGEQPLPDAIRNWAKERLTSYEVPARIHVVDKLPRTVSDKILKPEARALIREIEGATP